MADWTEKEVEIILEDYFEMLTIEQNGKSINKTAHLNKLLKLLPQRSKGSIEFKHQNISAALNKLGKPWIEGYKPKPNYQKSLLDPMVADYLQSHPSVLDLFAHVAISSVDIKNVDFRNFVEKEPERKSKRVDTVEDSGIITPKALKLDYFEIERANRALGFSGEELVFNYERWRLIAAGKESLSERIEWVSRDRGDGLGYDILSKQFNGKDRYIEVKTTKQGKDSPIFFSKNEHKFSNKNSSRYYLYRVFDLKRSPKMFILKGKFQEFCTIDAVQYRGTFF